MAYTYGSLSTVYDSDYPSADKNAKKFVELWFAFAGAALGVAAVNHGVAMPVLMYLMAVLLVSFIVQGICLYNDNDRFSTTRQTAIALYPLLMLCFGMVMGFVYMGLNTLFQTISVAP